MTARTQVSTSLMILSILLVGAAGCAPQNMQPTVLATLPPSLTPTAIVNIPDGWETYANEGQCGFVISHPANIDISMQGTYNWLFTPTDADPGGQIRNFIYVSVIPDGFDSSGGEIIYNYDPAEMGILLNMQVGESRSLREDPNTAPWFTYTRVLDTVMDNQAAQTYENAQPWEFPLGTMEIRHYLQANGCTYLIGGYLATVGSGQPGAIDEELYREIINTIRVSQ